MEACDLEKLKEPFPVNRIHWRIGKKNGDKALVMAYIDARDVMVRLDKVCGLDGWQCRYSHVTPKGLICEIGIKVGDEWLWRANGAGDTNVEAEKGAMSDAFKRAGVMWGIGRYLYKLPNEWVNIDKNGKFNPPKLPSWADPTTRVVIKKEIIEKTLEHLQNGDELGIREIFEELTNEQQMAYWPKFKSHERRAIQTYLRGESNEL